MTDDLRGPVHIYNTPNIVYVVVVVLYVHVILTA